VRQNLSIVPFALVDRVLFSGTRAIGVRYIDREGRSVEVGAQTVVLAAGAYGSAPILMRSGVGPADELRTLGIEPILDLPVGRGLLDHPGVSTWVRVQQEWAIMGWPVAAVASRGSSYWATRARP